MKTLILITALLMSFSVNAANEEQCAQLAAQASHTSGMTEALNAKYAIKSMQALGCGGQRQQQHQEPDQVNTDPQFVPSIGQWCQVVDGVTHCWK